MSPLAAWVLILFLAALLVGAFCLADRIADRRTARRSPDLDRLAEVLRPDRKESPSWPQPPTST